MPHLTGNTVPQRKQCLAELVQHRLAFLGHDAEIVANRVNAAGHNDSVLVKSSVGIIHLTATGSLDPNAFITVADFADGNQNFLAEKDFVAFGWNGEDGRAFIMFVPAVHAAGNRELRKQQIVSLRNRELSVVLARI